MSEWQPIETAPKKNGSGILCWDGGHRAICYWIGGEWVISNDHFARHKYTPTHWQPLSAPPETPDGD